MRKQFLPYCLPLIGEEEIAEVVDSLRSGWLTTGPKVRRFEDEFARYTGAAFAIAVNSCTSALRLSLAAAGVGPGDEVIVPTLTFCATANVVVHLGARPVLVDVDGQGLMDSAAVERAIGPRTKAIVPVHFAGQMCDLEALGAIARRNRVALIEDAAHAAGAVYAGKKIGTHGHSCAFSFYATKNMTTGEGGMITTSDEDTAVLIRRLSLHGMSRDAWQRYTEAGTWFYEVLEPGYKDNMTDIQASLGLHQLRRLDSFISRRREIASRYANAFAHLDELELPIELPGRTHVYHLYPIRLLAGRLSLTRSEFIDQLKLRHIGASVHFIPLHRHPYYRSQFGYHERDFPVADRLYQEYVSLPLYPRMTDQDIEDVIESVTEIVQTHRIHPFTVPEIARQTQAAATGRRLRP